MLGFSICLIFAGLLAVSAFLETKPNKNILIGVTLPLAHQKDEPVLAIVKKVPETIAAFMRDCRASSPSADLAP